MSSLLRQNAFQNAVDNHNFNLGLAKYWKRYIFFALKSVQDLSSVPVSAKNCEVIKEDLWCTVEPPSVNSFTVESSVRKTFGPNNIVVSLIFATNSAYTNKYHIIRKHVHHRFFFVVFFLCLWNKTCLKCISLKYTRKYVYNIFILCTTAKWLQNKLHVEVV